MQRDFHALGTQVRLIVRAEREGVGEVDAAATAAACAALAAAEEAVHAGEALLSRFRPDSELSQLNAAGGQPLRVSRLTADCVAAAVTAAVRTNGMFDPTLLPELLAAGYTTTFEQVPTVQAARPFAMPPAPPAPGRWRGVAVDSPTCLVQLPPGVQLDLGGVGKGFLMDQILPGLLAHGPALASSGGDMALYAPPGERPWCIEVLDSRPAGGTLCHLALRQGAVATSSRLKRRWQAGDTEMHHLIDPRTGRPAATDLLQVTVIAGSAVAADALAKVALIVGRDAAVPFLAAQGAPALLLDEAGIAWYTPDLGGFLHEAVHELRPLGSA